MFFARLLLARGGISNAAYLGCVAAMHLPLTLLVVGVPIWQGPLLNVARYGENFSAALIYEMLAIAGGMASLAAMTLWIGVGATLMRIRSSKRKTRAVILTMLGSILPPVLFLMPIAGSVPFARPQVSARTARIMMMLAIILAAPAIYFSAETAKIIQTALAMRSNLG